MSDTLLVGSTVRTYITVTDPHTDQPTDAAVTLIIIAPDGSQTTETPAHPATGVYEHFLPLTEAGDWYAVWTASSAGLTTVKQCHYCADPSGIEAE